MRLRWNVGERFWPAVPGPAPRLLPPPQPALLPLPEAASLLRRAGPGPAQVTLPHPVLHCAGWGQHLRRLLGGAPGPHGGLAGGGGAALHQDWLLHCVAQVHLLVKEQESAVKAVRLERLVGTIGRPIKNR